MDSALAACIGLLLDGVRGLGLLFAEAETHKNIKVHLDCLHASAEFASVDATEANHYWTLNQHPHSQVR